MREIGGTTVLHREVSGATVQRTQCPYEFGCLGNWPWHVCEAKGPCRDKGLPVSAPERKPCPYSRESGRDCVCSCPTRIEMYDRHER